MLQNYLITAYRNLVRNPVFSSINILGLAVGLASSILILIFVQRELSYDTFHHNAGSIFRVTETFQNGDQLTTTAITPYQIGPLAKQELKEVESFVRMMYTVGPTASIVHDDARFDITGGITFVDANFFNFFTFGPLEGDPDPLAQPNSLVISRSKAEMIFGDQNPIGKLVRVENVYDGEGPTFTITGVMEDMPANSHFEYHYLGSMATAAEYYSNMTESWGWTSQFTYLRLTAPLEAEEARKGLASLVEDHAPDWFKEFCSLDLQPMVDIHLRSQLKEEHGPNGNMLYVRLLGGIAAFLVLIAYINYINLTTALAHRRGKEIGIRKTIGAGRWQLANQFLGESVGITSLALILAFALVQILLPFFNELVGAELDLWGQRWIDVGLALGGILVLSVLAGFYPALIQSSFRPLEVLKETRVRLGRLTLNLRKGLVLIQFSISIGLIISTLIILSQWDYLRNRNLGLNPDGVVEVSLDTRHSREEFELIKNEFLKIVGVVSVGATSKGIDERYDSFWFLSNPATGEQTSMPLEAVDHDYFKVMNVTLVEGRYFSTEYPSDSSDALILNQAAVEVLGLNEPVASRLVSGDGVSAGPEQRVVGVVKDFHFEPLRAKLGPVTFRLSRGTDLQRLVVRLRSGDLQGTLDRLQSVWTGIVQRPMAYRFLDETLANQYHSERLFLTVFGLFSSLAIFIACIGILGLSTITIQHRAKEIGVRKVLGASSAQLVLLLTRETVFLTLLSNLFAWPLAFWIMSEWLSGFPYRIDINPWFFMAGALLGFIISMGTVGAGAFKSAEENPVKALRYE